MIGREDEVRQYRQRVGGVGYLFLVALMLLTSRLGYLQVVRGDELARYSEANRLKKEKVAAPRGTIVDRQGRVLVDNRVSLDVIVLPQYYHFDVTTNARLAEILGLSVRELENRLAGAESSFAPILLRADISKDTVAALEMNLPGFPGVEIEPSLQRHYPYGESAAQVLGYVGEVDPSDCQRDLRLQPGDMIGKMGLERKFDSLLRGQNGVRYVEVDARGRRHATEDQEKVWGYASHTDPLPGHNLQLTLDIELENVALHALSSRGLSGSVVAIDPHRGEVLAMANWPSFSPQILARRDLSAKVWRELSRDPRRPLRNRAVQDHFPPGSTFKPVLALAGLAEGVATPATTFDCQGLMRFGKHVFNCWHHHGRLDLIGALRESCDVFFYNLGLQLGIDPIAKYARLLGLGSPSGIDLPSEQRGLIPDSAWKKRVFGERWQPGETLSVAIGQGYVVATPLQMARAYAALATGGYLYQPYLVRRIESVDGQTVLDHSPQLSSRIDVKPEIFEAVQKGLFEVVNQQGGTGRSMRFGDLSIAGKTGTAQVRDFANMRQVKCDTLPVRERHHAWFVGYAPIEDPQIVVAVIAEHACHGAATPIAREVMEAFFHGRTGVAAN